MIEPLIVHAIEPDAREWITAEIARAGRRITPGADEPRVRPWSTVLRIATDGGPVWFKANGPGTTYEPWLVSALADWAPGRALAPLATDPDRGWSLLPDGRVDDMVGHGVPEDRPAHMPGRLVCTARRSGHPTEHRARRSS